MATISIPYFRSKPGKAGSKRYYWDPSEQLRDQGWRMRTLSPNREEAMAEAEAINAEVARWRAETGGVDQPRGKPADGTLAAVIAAYKASRDFSSLAAKTRQDYDYHLSVLGEWAGPMPVAGLKRSQIRQFYEAWHARVPHQANYIMRVLRVVLNFAVEREMLAATPMHRFKLLDPGRTTEPMLWTDDMVEAFVAEADARGRHSIGTAVMLNAWLGQREGDVISLSRSAYVNGAIWVRQRKTGAEVDLPVDEVPALTARLRDELARSSAVTIIASEATGRPYTADNFRQVFAGIRDAVPACEGQRFMWLRHTAVTRMAEAGCSTSYIGSITGHSDESIDQIIRRYRVRTRKMAVSAFRMRLAAEAGNG